MKRLALIPARGGSKRLPRKNILPFAGRPMIEWTIDAALESDLFSDVIVSTDDDEIASIGRAAGAEVHMRGEEISNDASTLIQVVKHTLEHEDPDQICMLLANCPLRTAEDIKSSSEAFLEHNIPAALSVTSFLWTPPFRALTMADDGTIAGAFDDWIMKKSQLYPDVVCPSGAIYWARPDVMRTAEDLYVPGLRGIKMPWYRAIDIDTREDFQLAECVKAGLAAGYRFDD